MLRKSSLALAICVCLFLAPAVITLLLVVQQAANPPESFGESSFTFPVRQESDLKPRGRR